MQYVPRDGPDQGEKIIMIQHGLSTTEMSSLINEWIFSERDRKILRRRYLDHITYECLSEEFGLSARQIKNIVYKSEKKLIQHI